jgi:CheY-like chemotaxis protein
MEESIMAKIVFCEDEGRIRKLIRAMLESKPYEIYMAADGIEGLELIERERPDLIFADISMPGYDGIQLADIVKSRLHLAKIPFIFLTAFAQQAEKAEGHLHGASDYLTKPFSVADLVEKIEQFLPPEAHSIKEEALHETHNEGNANYAKIESNKQRKRNPSY